jgi:hypothetical protein
MARWNKNDHITLSDAEFRLIVKQMRGKMEDKATAAAYLVMVNGLSQKDAFEQTGSSAANVNGAIQKITIRHKEIMDVYTERFNQKIAVMRLIEPVFDFSRGNDNAEDEEAKAG